MQHENNENDMIFGIRATIEAIRAGKEINKIIIQKGLQGDLFREFKNEISGMEHLVQLVPIEKLNRITRKNHQGVISFVSPVTYYSIEEIVPKIFEEGKNPLLLILDRVTDVRNFGAICRSAECLGVDAVVIPSRGSAAINADAVKTSAGALHTLPVCRENNLKNTIDYLLESGIQVVGCTEKGSEDVEKCDLTPPTAIIMGSEDEGISPEYLKRCNARVKIPMTGKIESLNVSVATGIILYEVVRQRMKI
jgi:23S rRNA (guanosine2251-2'-O)-methyltransferase